MCAAISRGVLARARQVFSQSWSRTKQAPPRQDASLAATFDPPAAWREGWTVSEHGRNLDGSVCIQLLRLDRMPDGGRPAFGSDGDAWRHVVARARAGSRQHAAALALIDQHERRIIEAHCGYWTANPD